MCDIRTDGNSPMFYRTLSLLGPLPKKYHNTAAQQEFDESQMTRLKLQDQNSICLQISSEYKMRRRIFEPPYSPIGTY